MSPRAFMIEKEEMFLLNSDPLNSIPKLSSFFFLVNVDDRFRSSNSLQSIQRGLRGTEIPVNLSQRACKTESSILYQPYKVLSKFIKKNK